VPQLPISFSVAPEFLGGCKRHASYVNVPGSLAPFCRWAFSTIKDCLLLTFLRTIIILVAFPAYILMPLLVCLSSALHLCRPTNCLALPRKTNAKPNTNQMKTKCRKKIEKPNENQKQSPLPKGLGVGMVQQAPHN